SCRQTIKQFESLVANAIPTMAAQYAADDIDPGPAWLQRRAEATCLNRIAQKKNSQNAGGREKQIVPSKGLMQVLPFIGGPTWRNVWTLYAAGVQLAAALGICLYQVGMRRGVDTAKLTLPQLNQQNEASLEAQVGDATHQRELVLA